MPLEPLAEFIDRGEFPAPLLSGVPTAVSGSPRSNLDLSAQSTGRPPKSPPTPFESTGESRTNRTTRVKKRNDFFRERNFSVQKRNFPFRKRNFRFVSASI